MYLLPTKSALLHMRFFFSFFLLPVYVFALSQVPQFTILNAVLIFVAWHLFVYPASNGYNSYFDKDEGSIALLEKPPQVDKSLYWFSLMFGAIGFIIGLFVSLEFALATLIYGFLSKMYSHPAIRLKKYPVISFLVVFIFQGAFVYWTTYAALAGQSMFQIKADGFLIAGIICSCLIGASYPLTQVYQHDEDRKRGDKTLSLLLGVKGSFIFPGLMFALSVFLMFRYWMLVKQPQNFWLFLIFVAPVMLVFFRWFFNVLEDKRNADFKNMSYMTLTSGSAMLAYFVLILLLRYT